MDTGRGQIVISALVAPAGHFVLHNVALSLRRKRPIPPDPGAAAILNKHRARKLLHKSMKLDPTRSPPVSDFFFSKPTLS
jgi:hypothetical protein